MSDDETTALRHRAANEPIPYRVWTKLSEEARARVNGLSPTQARRLLEAPAATRAKTEPMPRLRLWALVRRCRRP